MLTASEVEQVKQMNKTVKSDLEEFLGYVIKFETIFESLPWYWKIGRNWVVRKGIRNLKDSYASLLSLTVNPITVAETVKEDRGNLDSYFAELKATVELIKDTAAIQTTELAAKAMMIHSSRGGVEWQTTSK
jgi:hypothetical protein